MKTVKIKCNNCNGKGETFHHSKEHNENQSMSCWACGCGYEKCKKCEGKGII